MIDSQVFLLGLLAVSVLTGLATEAVKKILSEHNRTYRANTLAGVIATLISIAVGCGYVLIMEIGFTTNVIVYLVALVFLSWICAMVGYDKVIQAISQFNIYEKKGDTNE